MLLRVISWIVLPLRLLLTTFSETYENENRTRAVSLIRLTSLSTSLSLLLLPRLDAVYALFWFNCNGFETGHANQSGRRTLWL